MDETLNGVVSINQMLTKPIAFNCWKHHLGYIKSTLSLKDLNVVNHLNIHETLQFIGESQIDFYYGSLDPECISNQIIRQIESKINLNLSDFQEWVGLDDPNYKNLILSDGSNWTIRLGESDERYIHIHPSRYSKKTIRVKSSTLKTVIAYLFQYGFSDEQLSVEKVNRVRHKIAKLPPFKSNSPLVAISRVTKLFLSDLVECT